jgi:hypothetical protein
MPRYAIYDNGAFTGAERDLADKPVLHGKPYRRFYRVEEPPAPAYDPVTQERLGPFVEEDHLAEIRRYRWEVQDKTQERIAQDEDAAREAKIDAMDIALTRLAFDAHNRLAMLETICFRMWNRIRELEQGTPPIALDEFRKIMNTAIAPGKVTAHQFRDLIRSYLP